MYMQLLFQQFTSLRHIALVGKIPTKTMEIDGMNIVLQLWELSNNEGHRQVNRHSLSCAAGALIVYDITDRNSFESISAKWLTEAKLYGSPELEVLLVGNKNDLGQEYIEFQCRRAVSYEEAAQFAQDNSVSFMELSAKSAEIVDEVGVSTLRLLQDVPREF